MFGDVIEVVTTFEVTIIEIELSVVVIKGPFSCEINVVADGKWVVGSKPMFTVVDDDCSEKRSERTYV